MGLLGEGGIRLSSRHRRERRVRDRYEVRYRPASAPMQMKTVTPVNTMAKNTNAQMPTNFAIFCFERIAS